MTAKNLPKFRPKMSVAGLMLTGKPSNDAPNSRIRQMASRRENESVDLPMQERLTELGLSDFVSKFQEEKIRLEDLPSLTNEDLKELGLKLGERKRFLLHFEDRSSSINSKTSTEEKTNGVTTVVPLDGKIENMIHIFEHPHQEESIWGEYCGDIVEGVPEGKGKWTTKRDGREGELYFVYEGDMREGKRWGRGSIVYYSELAGHRYDGEWENNFRKGEGVYHYPDGDRYVGEWKDDEKEGKGVMFYDDGDRFVGAWKNDRPEGRGVYHLGIDNFMEGEWKDGFWLVNNSGGRHAGEWKDGKPEGKGVKVFADGGRYDVNEMCRDRLELDPNEKTVCVLVGRTGSGKSTLGNVLLKRTDAFKEENSSVSVTRRVEKQSNSEFEIVDTVGIGDTEMSEVDVIRALYDVIGVTTPVVDETLLNRGRETVASYNFIKRYAGFNVLIFVYKGRWDSPVQKALQVVIGVFEEAVLDRILLVRSNFVEFQNERKCEEDKMKFLGMVRSKNKWKESWVKKLKDRIVHLDCESTSRENWKEKRLACYHRMKKCIGSNFNGRYFPTKWNTTALIKNQRNTESIIQGESEIIESQNQVNLLDEERRKLEEEQKKFEKERERTRQAWERRLKEESAEESEAEHRRRMEMEQRANEMKNDRVAANTKKRLMELERRQKEGILSLDTRLKEQERREEKRQKDNEDNKLFRKVLVAGILFGPVGVAATLGPEMVKNEKRKRKEGKKKGKCSLM